MEDSEKIRKMAYAAVFAALTGASALITIPLGPVPFTLQTFFVLLAGFLLGAKWGFIAIALYLLLGVAGLPVFSGGGAGAGHLLGPTGGYLLAFPFAAGLAGLLAEVGDGRTGFQRLSLKALGGAIGTIVILAIGTARLIDFMGLSVEAGIAVGAAPFIVPSLIEIALAVSLSESLSRAGVTSASTGPQVRGVEERALYGVALGLGLVMSVLIPWAHLTETVERGEDEGVLEAGISGYFTGGEVTLSGEVADEVVATTVTAPSIALHGLVAGVLGLIGIALAIGAVKGVHESRIAAGYLAIGIVGPMVTAVSYFEIAAWSLEVSHSVGYGVYLPALMGVGFLALGAHSIRIDEPSGEIIGA